MPHTNLEYLKSEEFLIAIGFIPPPKALRILLSKTKACSAIKDSYRQGEITSDDIRDFVSQCMRDYKTGKTFPHQIALATIAVALESSYDSFSEEFLCDLSKLSLSELSISISVATICLSKRCNFISTKAKTFKVIPFFPLSLVNEQRESSDITFESRAT